MNHRFILIATLLASLANCELYRDFLKRVYEDQKWKVDKSAATVCYVVSGQLEQVNPDDAQFGYTCNAVLKAHSADQKVADEMCKSTFPHYILEAEVVGDATRCKFIILTRCEPDYFLIYETCYKTVELDLTYNEATKFCETKQGNKTDARLAEYTSPILGIDLKHMDFTEAWVRVPELGEYFSNGDGEGGAVFVVRDSWKYERTEGSIEMVDLDSKHFPLCEYTPMKGMAHITWMARMIGDAGLIPVTVSSTGLVVNPEYYAGIPSSDIGKFGESIGSILGITMNKIHSHPNARTRPPITFGGVKYAFGGCPPGWFLYIRANDDHFCHFVNQTASIGRAETKRRCALDGAQLTGFDSMEELQTVMSHFQLTGSRFTAFHIGAKMSCDVPGCNDSPKVVSLGQTKYMVSWENNVATNLEMLYPIKYKVYDAPNAEVEYLFNYGRDYLVVWTSKPGTWDTDEYMCGKFANMVPESMN